jgi:hypothetical protein
MMAARFGATGPDLRCSNNEDKDLMPNKREIIDADPGSRLILPGKRSGWM